MDKNQTILTPMKPMQRSYAHDMTQILSTTEVFTPEECQQIIDLYGDKVESGRMIGDTEDGTGVIDDYRISDLYWIPPNPEAFPFMDAILGIVMRANERFEFEVDHFEAFQLTRYEAPGGHYDYHKDIGGGPTGHRKLSLTVQLSSPDDYRGGELQILSGKEPWTAPKEQGSVTVFPSWERHRVTPVESGTRWSLVTWACGESRFR